MYDNDKNDDLFEGFEGEVDTKPPGAGKDFEAENFFNSEEVLGDEKDPLIEKLLEAKGLKNGKAKIVQEDGTEGELDFYSLSEDEKIELLTAEIEDGAELNSEEKTLINHLRENNVSLKDFLENYKNQVLSEAASETVMTYDIDNYDDEELFILDLQAKYELSEEELVQELETALKNKPLFDKKVSKLREEYKVLEDQYKESIRTEEYNKFVNTVNTAANNLSEFHGIVLEDSDKAEAIKYLTELDSEGLSAFSRDLRDPKKIFEVAWYLRWGKDAFKAIENAYENEINKLKKR